MAAARSSEGDPVAKPSRPTAPRFTDAIVRGRLRMSSCTPSSGRWPLLDMERARIRGVDAVYWRVVARLHGLRENGYAWGSPSGDGAHDERPRSESPSRLDSTVPFGGGLRRLALGVNPSCHWNAGGDRGGFATCCLGAEDEGGRSFAGVSGPTGGATQGANVLQPALLESALQIQSQAGGCS